MSIQARQLDKNTPGWRYYQPYNATPVGIEGSVAIPAVPAADFRAELCRMPVQPQEVLVVQEYSLFGFDQATFDPLSPAAAYGKFSWNVTAESDTLFTFRNQFGVAPTTASPGFSLFRRRDSHDGSPTLVFWGPGFARILVRAQALAVGLPIPAGGWLFVGSLSGYKFRIQTPDVNEEVKLRQAVREMLEQCYPNLIHIAG